MYNSYNKSNNEMSSSLLDCDKKFEAPCSKNSTKR